MIKNLVFSLLALLFVSCAVNEANLQKKEPIKEAINEELISQVRYILHLLENNNTKKLNSDYINKELGYYEVSLDENLNTPTIMKKTKLTDLDDYVESYNVQNIEVDFHCSPHNDAFYGWDNDGVFIFDPKNNYLVNKLETSTGKEQEFIKQIIQNSYEVVITNNMIFYITKVDKKYYITLIDNLKTNCSNALANL